MLVQAVSAVVTTNRAKKYQARLTGLLLAGRLRRHGPANARPERRPNPVQRTGRMENDQDGAGSVGTQLSATGPGVNLSDDHESLARQVGAEEADAPRLRSGVRRRRPAAGP